MASDLQFLFKKHDDEHGMFERIVFPVSQCPDICAMLLLEDICNHRARMIAGTAHDVVYLSVDPSDVAGKITEDQVIYLSRCGVMFDEAENSFFMFV